MKILVLGATGNCGRSVVQALSNKILEDQSLQGITILAATRDEKSASAQQLGALPGVTIVRADINDAEALSEACLGVHRVFLCMPQSFAPEQMVLCQELLANIIEKQSPTVEVLVKVSAFAADERSCKFIQTQGALGEAHAQGERRFSSLPLSLISLRPTSFFSNFKWDIPSIRSSRSFSSPIGVGAKVNWVSCEDVGEVGAHCLLMTKDELAPFSVYDLTGPSDSTLAGTEVAEILTSLLNEQVTRTHAPLKDSSSPYFALWDLLNKGGFDITTDIVPKLLGKPARSFRDYLREKVPEMM